LVAREHTLDKLVEHELIARRIDKLRVGWMNDFGQWLYRRR
jgi:hypothetical protein